jgi:hypothetical protein
MSYVSEGGRGGARGTGSAQGGLTLAQDDGAGAGKHHTRLHGDHSVGDKVHVSQRLNFISCYSSC